jgi:hypothetical protein
MLEELLLHIRYPYTAGVIATLWLGTAGLAVLGGAGTNVANMVLINIFTTTVIAVIGFSSSRR